MNDTVMTKPQFDRTVEDLGNIVELGHVNVTVPDQSKAIAFYLMGLGLTRDPYLMAGLENMWVNVGRGQFHLPTRSPAQVVRGTTGLVVPDLEALLKRNTRRRFWKARSSATRRWATSSRRHARGATESACMDRSLRISDRCVSACRMSSSTSRPAPISQRSRGFIRKSWMA